MDATPTGGAILLSQKSATEVKPQQLSLLAEPQKEPEPIKLQDYSKNQHKELKAKLTTRQAS